VNKNKYLNIFRSHQMSNRPGALQNFRGEFYETLDNLKLLYSEYWTLDLIHLVPFSIWEDVQRLQERDMTYIFMQDPVKADPIKLAIWESNQDVGNIEKEERKFASYATEKEFICLMLAVTGYNEFEGNFC